MMIPRILFVALCVSTALSALPARADDGSSGCGLGWKVAPRQSLLSSSTRSPINFTFSNTSGMTSGTSGCAKHSIVQNDKKAIHYAEVNQGQLIVEMAQGGGEHVRGLALTLGCPASAVDAFERAVQADYSNIFPDSGASPRRMLDGARSTIRKEPALALQCGLTA